MSGALFQAFGGLAIVVALMFGSAWIFRRSGGLQAINRGPVKIVGGVRVGTRERVMVLEVADTWLVVGVTAGQINALHTLPRQLEDQPSATQTLASPFPQWLARFTPNGSRDST